MKQTLIELNGEIDSNTIIVGDFNISLSAIDKTSRQKIKRETEELNNTVEQMT